MNMAKKFDRMKQWTEEKINQKSKTGVSDEFKSLEMEMQLRHEGTEKLQKSMTIYVKSLSKRNEVDNKEKILPVAHMGQTMIHHGEDFDPDSEFGNCLIAMGHANDTIARIQDSYVASATTSWLESLERSLAMMKEYQAARKKLEQRRLAYDASLSKMQNAKKEDFRVEEELRSQKAKYEESNEDVFRRMQDIKEAEADSVQDLGAFVDAELEYYDRCRDELLKLKSDWPAANSAPQQRQQPKRHNARSRSNTAHSYSERYPANEEVEARPTIRAANRAIPSSRGASTSRLAPPESPESAEEYSRPGIKRAFTTQVNSSIPRDLPRMNPIPPPSELSSIRLRPTIAPDVLTDPSDDSTLNGYSPDGNGDRSVSPATSYGSRGSRSTSQSAPTTRRKAPPPPPSRNKKPAIYTTVN